MTTLPTPSTQAPAMHFTLPLGPSANRYWRTFRGMTVVSAEAKAYKALVAALLVSHRLVPLVGNVTIRVKVYRKQKSGDLDNFLKVLLDSLKHLAYHDDSQVTRIEAERHDDKKNPRFEVEIELASGGQMALGAK